MAIIFILAIGIAFFSGVICGGVREKIEVLKNTDKTITKLQKIKPNLTMKDILNFFED